MKNPEKLIGKKVRGFKFEEFTHAGFTETMESFIGKDGIIESGETALQTDFYVKYESVEDYYNQTFKN